MMKNFQIILEYDGTGFRGWQVQKKGERTVQSELQKALKKIFRKPVKVFGSGRTDSGVHALGQTANFNVNTEKDEHEIKSALNAHLPEDVCVAGLKETGSEFHAQYDAKSKTYRYQILNRPERPVLNRNTVLHYPHKLNISRMKRAATPLIGRHDFAAFQSSGSPRKSGNTVRNIRRIDIKKKQDLVTIDIEADGFLYKMVRNIVGTLLSTGSGKLEADNVKTVLKRKDRKLAGATAKAKGLILLEVKY